MFPIPTHTPRRAHAYPCAPRRTGLLAEINNGRLAMIGIMGFCAEQKVPGSVPWGPHLKEYAGDFMQPF